MKRSGSSIVLVLCVVSAITMLMTIVLRSSLFSHDLALKRVQYEKYVWIANAYEQYAIAYLSDQAARIIKNNQIITLSPIIINHYYGTIELIPKKQSIDVSVILKSDENELLHTTIFSYHFILDDMGWQTEIAISNWHQK